MIQLLLGVIYLAFISLGLPDSMLGSAWPSMYLELGVPISFAGIISMIIALGTVVSSLASDTLVKKIGTGKITALSVATTAIALFGFSVSKSFWMICLFAVPYGLGAGSVDAALNNFVALHYASRHMSWLHCMWGVGTIIGPNIMALALTSGQGWNDGFLYVSLIQMTLTVILIIAIPLWKKKASASAVSEKTENTESLSLIKVLHIKGAKEVLISFFCYCALEATVMLWASSYMVFHNGMSEEKAASCVGIFFIGITVGRLFNGFLTYKLSDTKIIRLGQGLIVIGAILLLIPLGQVISIVGLVIIGLGFAPIYPCIIHSTPALFGAENSQAVIGVQMASAYAGTCLMPLIFGLIANHIDVALLPVFILFFCFLMIFFHRRLIKKTA